MTETQTPWSRLSKKHTTWGELPDGETHGWIQWKGTEVCMDFHCKCGELTHIDGSFTYLIQCVHCKRIYWPDAHVKMLELEGEDRKDAEASESTVTSK